MPRKKKARRLERIRKELQTTPRRVRSRGVVPRLPAAPSSSSSAAAPALAPTLRRRPSCSTSAGGCCRPPSCSGGGLRCRRSRRAGPARIRAGRPRRIRDGPARTRALPRAHRWPRMGVLLPPPSSAPQRLHHRRGLTRRRHHPRMEGVGSRRRAGGRRALGVAAQCRRRGPPRAHRTKRRRGRGGDSRNGCRLSRRGRDRYYRREIGGEGTRLRHSRSGWRESGGNCCSGRERNEPESHEDRHHLARHPSLMPKTKT